MGVDISGGMIVGACSDDVWASCCPEEEDFYDFIEGVHEMDTYHLYYDADTDASITGFKVKDVPVLSSEEFEEWTTNVKELAKLFKDITGIEPKLIGMQHVR